MKVPFLVVLSSISLLAGCAASPLRPEAQSLVGISQSKLQAEWGRPDKKQTETDGSQIWVYARTFTTPGTNPLPGDFASKPAATTGAGTVYANESGTKTTCTTQFVISPAGTVSSTNTAGEGCSVGPARSS